MRKIALVAVALLVSVNVFAAGNDINSAIEKSFNTQNSPNHEPNSMIYGGKDISKPVVAAADESFWKGQTKLAG